MSKELRCEDCGLPYHCFGLDSHLSDKEWLLIHPSGEGGILCANCIFTRANKLGNVAVIYLKFDEPNFDIFRARIATIRQETLEECARLHESILPFCDHEPEIGAGAIGAIIRYRDAIRGLKEGKIR